MMDLIIPHSDPMRTPRVSARGLFFREMLNKKIMKDRKTDTFVYKGLGIPVKLVNVPMKKVFGEWYMDINFNKLQLAVLHCLLYKPAPLSGDELRYIRKFLELSMTDFGKIFGGYNGN